MINGVFMNKEILIYYLKNLSYNKNYYSTFTVNQIIDIEYHEYFIAFRTKDKYGSKYQSILNEEYDKIQKELRKLKLESL